MSKDIKKALEHCVEWKCDNCPNGDDLGGGETVCRGRLLPQVLEYVSDLEAKLADKEETIKELNDKVLWLRKWLKMADDLNGSLKQQLAEKDEEIKNLVLAHFESDANKSVLTTTKIINQDKISFCIEQLEKVKEFAKSIEEHIYNMYDNTKNTNVVSDYHYAKLTVISNIFKFIDNQIKQLKEGK